MITIGVVTKSVKTGNFLKDFFASFKCRILPVKEYDIKFAAVNDKCNYRRKFRKLKVKYVVALTDRTVEEDCFQIIDGNETYQKLLPQTVRKVLKGKTSTRVAIVDKEFSEYCTLLADKLCTVSSCLVFVTRCGEKAEHFCDLLMAKYGAPAEVACDEFVNCDVAVVLNPCRCRFKSETVVFKNNTTDFYIPFKVKPPFGMSNLVFADCIAKSIDNS